MSEDNRTDIVNPDAEPPKASTSGPADLTYGAAEPGEGRPDDAADRDDELAPSPDVHGEEGGGDPAAGAEEDAAEEDAAEEDDDERPRPRGFTP